uniref:SLC41A/MgtE integral membrane domain-containing protein n=1 Tax=Chromera velia CCMP2878 TaxID=1169474 RepID=A0A0G4F967_9ALVE|eukprot:Cvel_15826.t1-p1 / transcript=Cvel_15826.t1 / gene=Cvel_15826 / organism=Chromera_velia_CCMP2878 / gene_product=Magnesium transporter MgtE, putative / transcript_product=Magnesium transporter MgtE, putative / location=Cvel_scaffold1189:26684-31501(-) / protein_length=572 / sequence_SO=supercontig / SO=protein_coding / is_pseudo=false
MRAKELVFELQGALEELEGSLSEQLGQSDKCGSSLKRLRRVVEEAAKIWIATETDTQSEKDKEGKDEEKFQSSLSLSSSSTSVPPEKSLLSLSGSSLSSSSSSSSTTHRNTTLSLMGIRHFCSSLTGGTRSGEGGHRESLAWAAAELGDPTDSSLSAHSPQPLENYGTCTDMIGKTTNGLSKSTQRRKSEAGHPTSESTLLRGSPHRNERGRKDGEERGEKVTDTSPDTESEGLLTFWHRASWLVGLLFFQSASSAVLQAFDPLLHRHPVVVYFLTMLVGAGGNAGGQSAVLVIRGLAVNEVNEKTLDKFLYKQVLVGVKLAVLLSAAAFVRTFLFGANGPERAAVFVSMFVIVLVSVGVGTVLPLFLKKVGTDPAHAGAAIQVIMDICGVLLTCFICKAVLDSSDTLGRAGADLSVTHAEQTGTEAVKPCTDSLTARSLRPDSRSVVGQNLETAPVVGTLLTASSHISGDNAQLHSLGDPVPSSQFLRGLLRRDKEAVPVSGSSSTTSTLNLVQKGTRSGEGGGGGNNLIGSPSSSSQSSFSLKAFQSPSLWRKDGHHLHQENNKESDIIP